MDIIIIYARITNLQFKEQQGYLRPPILNWCNKIIFSKPLDSNNSTEKKEGLNSFQLSNDNFNPKTKLAPNEIIYNKVYRNLFLAEIDSTVNSLESSAKTLILLIKRLEQFNLVDHLKDEFHFISHGEQIGKKRISASSLPPDNYSEFGNVVFKEEIKLKSIIGFKHDQTDLIYREILCNQDLSFFNNSCNYLSIINSLTFEFKKKEIKSFLVPILINLTGIKETPISSQNEYYKEVIQTYNDFYLAAMESLETTILLMKEIGILKAWENLLIDLGLIRKENGVFNVPSLVDFKRDHLISFPEIKV